MWVLVSVAERGHPAEQHHRVRGHSPIVNSKSFYWQTRATWDRTRTYINELLVPDFLYDGGTGQGATAFYMTDDKRRVCMPR